VARCIVMGDHFLGIVVMGQRLGHRNYRTAVGFLWVPGIPPSAQHNGMALALSLVCSDD